MKQTLTHSFVLHKLKYHCETNIMLCRVPLVCNKLIFKANLLSPTLSLPLITHTRP